MGRPVRPINITQQQRAATRRDRAVRIKVRRLEAQVRQQRPYRATPNTETADAGVVTSTSAGAGS